MLNPRQLIWLEKLGIRSVFFLAPQGRIEAKLPTVAEARLATGYNPKILNDKLEQGRYFALTNLMRMVLHFPIIYFFLKYQFWGFAALFMAFCFWHSLLIFLELYKMSVLSMVTPNPNAEEPPGAEYRPNPWGDAWFLPKKFESVKRYEFFRMEKFQSFTLWVMHIARYTKEQRQEGRKIEFVSHASYSELARFEANTRVSELVHLIFCGWDTLPIIAVFMVHPSPYWWLIYHGWIFSGDFRLVLLQRYHRVRVWKTIMRFRDREENRKKKLITAPEPVGVA